MGKFKPALFLFFLAACAGPGGPIAVPSANLADADREMMRGEYGRAAVMYEAVAASGQGGSSSRARSAYLASVCRVKLGQPERAIPTLQKLGSSPVDVRLQIQALDTLSEAHRAMGQYPESLRVLQAIQRLPRADVEDAIKVDDFLFKLGCAHLRVADRDQASACFREMMQRYPTSLRAMDAALRLAVKGFAVRIGDPGPEDRKAPTGPACTMIKVSVKGQPTQSVPVITGIATYAGAIETASRLAREGIKTEPLP